MPRSEAELTLLLCLVRQHWSESHIPNSLDSLGGSVELIINDDSALLVGLHANGFEVQALGNGFPTNGNKDDIAVQLTGVSCRYHSGI